MKGYPHFLNTRFDYEYVADHFPREQWAKDWQSLLDELMQWQYVADLASREEGIEDATHRVEEVEDADGAVIYQQWEYKKDANARLYQLGFTEQEVRDKLNEA